MPRDVIVLLEDILLAITEIEDFLIEVNDVNAYKVDILRKRGVERNLEIIGEVVMKIPASLKLENPNVEWRQIAGLRDFIAHGYFEIDDEMIWKQWNFIYQILRRICKEIEVNSRTESLERLSKYDSKKNELSDKLTNKDAKQIWNHRHHLQLTEVNK